MFCDLLAATGRRPLVQQAGDKIGQSGFVRGVLRRTYLDERMDFHDGQVVLLQEQHRQTVRCHEANGIEIGCLCLWRTDGQGDQPEHEQRAVARNHTPRPNVVGEEAAAAVRSDTHRRSFAV